MADAGDDLQKQVEALRQRFLVGLGERLSDADDALARLESAGDETEAMGTIRQIRDIAHKLAGTAGTFGYTDAGKAASDLETLCDELIDDESGASAADAEKIRARLDDIKQKF